MIKIRCKIKIIIKIKTQIKIKIRINMHKDNQYNTIIENRNVIVRCIKLRNK